MASGVRVKELHPLVSNELLHEAFSVFGEVVRAVHLVDKQGRPVFEGSVDFKEKEAAERALRQISEGVFLLTRSQKPVAVQQLYRLEENMGQPEATIQRSPEYIKERAVGPRFAVEGTLEAKFGRQWKELYGREHVTLDQVAKDFLTERRALLTQQERIQEEEERTPEDMDTSHDLLDDARNEFGSAAAEHPVNPFDGGWGGDEEFEERGSNEQLAFLEEEEARNLSDYRFLQEAGVESGGSNGSWVNRTDETPPSAFLLAKSGPVGPRLSDSAPTAPRPHWGTLLNSPRAKRQAALKNGTGGSSGASTSGRKRRASSMEAVVPPKRLSYGSHTGDSLDRTFSSAESAVLTAPATQLVAPAQEHALGNARDEAQQEELEEAPEIELEEAQDHVDEREEAQEEELEEAQEEEEEREEDALEEEDAEAQPAPGEPASLNNRPARPLPALKSVQEVWTAAEEQTARKMRGGRGALARTRHGVPVALMPLPNESAEGLRCPHPGCARRHRRPFKSLRGLRSHVTRSHKDACSRCWERFEDAFTCAVHKELKCTRQPLCPDVGCRTPCRRGLVAHLIEGHHHQ